jgi:hypothetical protein
MKKPFIIFLLIIFPTFLAYSQDWVKTFQDGHIIGSAPWVIEVYDKGYVILANEYPPGYLWVD